MLINDQCYTLTRKSATINSDAKTYFSNCKLFKSSSYTSKTDVFNKSYKLNRREEGKKRS